MFSLLIRCFVNSFVGSLVIVVLIDIHKLFLYTTTTITQRSPIKNISLLVVYMPKNSRKSTIYTTLVTIISVLYFDGVVVVVYICCFRMIVLSFVRRQDAHTSSLQHTQIIDARAATEYIRMPPLQATC